MSQATFDLAPLPAEIDDRVGFDLGWDHARHGLVPPPELLLQGTPVCQGWMAGKAVLGRRALTAGRSVRLWLGLRILAWRRGIVFELQQVTPNFLAQIDSPRCPVLRLPLGGAPGEALSAVVERLNPQAGYAAGNLVTLSLQAAQARAGVTAAQAVRHANRAALLEEPVAGLDAAAWRRVAALAAFATPMPFFEVAHLPLAALPPNRVRLLNAAQGLQALVTQLFVRPGWSTRARALAAMLPEHTLRHDFNLFVGAVAPRLLEAGPAVADVRRVLEDAWLNERVQRRWQHLVLSLGEAATQALLDRAVAAGLAGPHTLNHGPEQATDGWALSAGGRMPVQRSAPAFTAPRPPKNNSATTGARLS